MPLFLSHSFSRRLSLLLHVTLRLSHSFAQCNCPFTTPPHFSNFPPLVYMYLFFTPPCRSLSSPSLYRWTCPSFTLPHCGMSLFSLFLTVPYPFSLLLPVTDSFLTTCVCGTFTFSLFLLFVAPPFSTLLYGTSTFLLLLPVATKWQFPCLTPSPRRLSLCYHCPSF